MDDLKQKVTYRSLRAWREARGLSQKDAAHIFGVTQAGYSRIERGKTHARHGLLKKLALATDVPLEVLTGVNR